MDILLPYPNMVVSAACLHEKRLSHQREVARLVQHHIQHPDRPWEGRESGAFRDWKDHILAVMLWGDICIKEWVRRGGQCEMPLMHSRSHHDSLYFSVDEIVMPLWLGDPDVHNRHRALLAEEDPDWYAQFGWGERPALSSLVSPRESVEQ